MFCIYAKLFEYAQISGNIVSFHPTCSIGMARHDVSRAHAVDISSSTWRSIALNSHWNTDAQGESSWRKGRYPLCCWGPAIQPAWKNRCANDDDDDEDDDDYDEDDDNDDDDDDDGSMIIKFHRFCGKNKFRRDVFQLDQPFRGRNLYDPSRYDGGQHWIGRVQRIQPWQRNDQSASRWPNAGEQGETDSCHHRHHGRNK